MAAALLVAAGCTTDFTDRILAVGGEGGVLVLLYRDDNLSSTFNAQTDAPLGQEMITLRRTATLAEASTRTTDSAGTVLFVRVPVGRYRLDPLAAVLGDSLERIDPTREFTVIADDTIAISVGLRFPSFTVSEARNLPIGKKVFVKGIVLNGQGTYGDSTVHLADTASFMRMSRVRPAPIEPGDSVQFLGTRAVRDGQPTFNVTLVLIRGDGDPLPPDTVTTAVAASAGGGPLDAAFLHIRAATIADTITGPEGKLLTVDDGSGPLGVLLSSNINFGNLNQLNAYAPGVRVTLLGLLVPDPLNPGRWILKPRGRPDIAIIP
jgi:hypothetical protein